MIRQVFIISLIWLRLLSPQILEGQIKGHFEALEVSGDISQSISYCIGQDSLGQIWAGTEEGVIRYNSRELFLYDKYKGLPDSISNRVNALLIDSKNHIWIGNEEGICQFNSLENRFDFIATNTEENLVLVNTIVEGRGDSIWIGAFNGLWLYHSLTGVFKQYFSDKNVLSLQEIENSLLVGTARGLYVFNYHNEIILPFSGEEFSEDLYISHIERKGNSVYIGSRGGGFYVGDISLNNMREIEIPTFQKEYFDVKDILLLDNGNLVLGTDGAGLILLDDQNTFMHSFVNNVDDPYSISSDGVYDLLQGRDGIIWVATFGGGINKWDTKVHFFENINHQVNDANSISNNFARAILEDREGRLWFGTKKGLNIWDREQDRWKNILSLSSNNRAPDIILDLEEDGDFIWVATYGKGLFKVHKNTFEVLHFGTDKNADHFLELNKIFSIRMDSNGLLWVGGINHELHSIDRNFRIKKYPINLVRTILETKNAKLVAGGRDGVQIIDGENIVDFPELKTGRNGLEYTNIHFIEEDSEGNLIIGTNGDGLIFFNPESRELSKLNFKDGMPSDIIQSIEIENDSSYWLGTTRGLVHLLLSERDTSIIVYNQDDGLISSEFNSVSSCFLKDGYMLFGTVDGLVMFDPSRIKRQTSAPTVFFEGIRFLEKKGEEKVFIPLLETPSNTLDLEYAENSFNIHFAGILHSSPNKVRYQWKMDGLNNDWSEPGEDNRINFINLSPGDYRFRLKASNRDGVWSPEKSLFITISPPWWASTWAYLLYALLILIAIGGLVFGVILYLNKRNAEEQINFFNSITHELKTPITILLSSLDAFTQNFDRANVDKIKSTSRKLINLFEQLLNFHLVSSGKQKMDNIESIALVPHIQKIIASFQPLMKEKQVRIELEDQWKKDHFYYDKYILDKILNNLISNAVKYSREKGLIRLLLKNKKSGLEITVSDNGIGIPKEQQKHILKKYYRGRNAINSQLPGTGLGLMIVKNLVEREKGYIKFSSIENEGSSFIVHLPQKEKPESRKLEETKGYEQPIEELFEKEDLAEFSDSKILIVEDNNDLRANLVERLGIYFQVYEAENGKQGLEIAAEVFPDLIISDLIMPEMDGIEMAKTLQNDINLSHIPIIMMTVLTSQKQKLESIGSGVSTYLEKPIDFDYLMAKIITTLNWSKKLREKYLHQVDIENAEKFRNQKDADFINQLERFVLQEIKEENLSVNDLCQFVGMSRTALYMKLKSMVDLSPQNFIIHTRLKFARKKLVEGELNIKEVAYMSGFSSPKYFSTSFKKLFGESPTNFLKNLQN